VKRIAVLGSTGSIGTSTLDVVRALPGRFRVVALSAGRGVDRLAEQVRTHRPERVAVADADVAADLAACLPEGPDRPEIVSGPDGLDRLVRSSSADLVVSGIVGAAGLRPTMAAVDAGIDVALANKESLVVAGAIVTARARETGAALIPVDSEHNAIHQCLRGERVEQVRSLWLTASGGPFRGVRRDALREVTPEQALDHPTWSMGPRITVDSATLMNKGLEVIEASHLFGVPSARIRVVVHPQSVVHSMVEFVDGSFKAQLGITDMRHPIQYALTWPDRIETTLPALDPRGLADLTFEAPDPERFPCLDLAWRALEAGGGAPAALNAADEVAVEAFLGGRLRFDRIPVVVSRALDEFGGRGANSIDDVLAVDRAVRSASAAWISGGGVGS